MAEYQKTPKPMEDLGKLVMKAESNLEKTTSYKEVNFSDCSCPCPPVAREVLYVTFSPIM